VYGNGRAEEKEMEINSFTGANITHIRALLFQSAITLDHPE
jgi:hypothetical protein